MSRRFAALPLLFATLCAPLAWALPPMAAGTAKISKPTAVPAPAPIDLGVRNLTALQFEALPDAQVLVFEGQRLTAGDIRARGRLWDSQRTSLVTDAVKRLGAQVTVPTGRAAKGPGTDADVQRAASEFRQKYHAALLPH